MTAIQSVVAGCMGRTPQISTYTIENESIYTGYGFGVTVGNLSIGSCTSGVCGGLPTGHACGTGGSGFFIGTQSGADFSIQRSGGNSNQSCIGTGVRVQDSTGAIREYLYSAATFSSGSQQSWIWGTGSNQVWPASANGMSRTVEWF